MLMAQLMRGTGTVQKAHLTHVHYMMPRDHPTHVHYTMLKDPQMRGCWKMPMDRLILVRW
jgi:hypothetical protein